MYYDYTFIGVFFVRSGLSNKFPEIAEIFERTKAERIEDIIAKLMENDNFYNTLLKKRSEQSGNLVNKLSIDANIEYDNYMDLVFEQSNYEWNLIYEFAFYDAILLLEKLNLLSPK